MISAPLHPQEEKRLKILRYLEVLDTELEESYDELTTLAAKVCDVPISAVSLIDEDRQWFKSHYGLDASETPREYAFCAHTILGEDVFEVPNALEDERFKDNPLVTGEPQVIFYAGAPIKATDDINLGSLCVIDNIPKKLDQFQQDFLQVLAKQVSNQLKLRKLLKDMDVLNGKIQIENNFKTKFFATVNHEIRSSLNNLIGLMSALTQSELTDEQREFIKLAEEENCNLLGIMNDILDLSKMESGKIEIHHDVFLLHESINSVVRFFEAEAKRKNLSLNLSIESNVPSKVNGDEVRIKQILINYISNALKFTTKGHVNIFVKLADSKSLSGWCNLLFSVEDTGIGIAKRQLDKVFNYYDQDQTKLKKSFGGSGLGLYMCKKLASAMGGAVAVESIEGEGSTFQLEIPLEVIDL